MNIFIYLLFINIINKQSIHFYDNDNINNQKKKNEFK